MIRVIIFIIGLFLFWVWFASPLSRTPKIGITLLALALSVALVAYESYSNKPRANLLELQQIEICGLDVQHSYRSDFRVRLCLKNSATRGTVKRIAFSVHAKQCNTENDCNDLERVKRDIPLNIAPNQVIELEETLRFENVPINIDDIVWSAVVEQIKAVP